MYKQKIEEKEDETLLSTIPIQKNYISVGGAIGLSFSIILLLVAFLILYSLIIQEEEGFYSWRGFKSFLFERNLLDQLSNAWKYLVKDIVNALKKIPKVKL